MDVYVARQPIFNCGMQTCGYELLYRQNSKNFFPGGNDDEITAELIYNSFVVVGLKNLTGGTRAFINFSKELISSDIPYLLPKEDVVIEILERGNATQDMVDACKKLRQLGYTIALDDFIPDQDSLPLIELVDIVKVEYPAVSFYDQRRLIRKYGSRVKFLAEKIETRADYQLAAKMGYQFFQGYFFSKPVVINSSDIATLDVNLFRITEELKKEEPNFTIIANIIERDLGLSYKLMKLANSAYFGGGKNQIHPQRADVSGHWGAVPVDLRHDV